MERVGQSASPQFIVLGMAVLLSGGVALAENTDPANDASQYAWTENLGWINAEPSGDGGPGMQVNDFELTGYLWGENVGWISLSCKNESTCGASEFGVINDGQGALSGFAWSENVGWINFKPLTAGVFIDVTTGEFSGRAWGENVGWITFASNGANPFKVKAEWNCVPGPQPPTGAPALVLDKSGASVQLAWGGVGGATGYDVVKGDLAALRSTGGNLAAATSNCRSNNRTTTTMMDSIALAPGQGSWFLVRGENCGGRGTYDEGVASQVGLRDSEIGTSGSDCP